MRAVPTELVPKTTRTRLALSLAIGRFCRCRRAGSAASGLSRLCACLDGEKLSEVCYGKIRRLCGFCGVLMVDGLEARKSNRPRCLRRLRAVERGWRDGVNPLVTLHAGAPRQTTRHAACYRLQEQSHKAATVGRAPDRQHNSQGIQPPLHDHRDQRSRLYVKRQPH
jgi:hypothetical protein